MTLGADPAQVLASSAHEAGITALLQKPIRIQALLDQVTALLIATGTTPASAQDEPA